MNNFFLLNEAINVADFNDFKSGMSELAAIDKVKDDVFMKHNTVYEVPMYEQLCSTWGQIEQTIIIFIEQLNSYEHYLADEGIFDVHFVETNNAFLGIDFSKHNILPTKQIIDNTSYNDYRIGVLSLFDKLLSDLGNCVYPPRFEKDFKLLSNAVQQSIIDEFSKAKSKGLVTPYSPDGQVIKDVTPKTHKCAVLELRVYSPVALRVYFNENADRICLGTIEQKSNPNQNQDINSAHTVLSAL